MPGEANRKLALRLLSESLLTREDVQQAFSIYRRIHEDELAAAAAIVPGADLYLRQSHVTAIILDEISDNEALSEIKAQTAFLGRSAHLLPTLLSYYKFDPLDRVFDAIGCVDDCHSDYPVVLSNKRQDRHRRETITNLVRSIELIGECLAELKSLTWEAQFEFDRTAESLAQAVSVPVSSFDNLLSGMDLCQSALKIANYRASTEPKYLFPSNNQAKTHIVECAYTMSRYWEGPPITTTPGSDFSTICSLLYELISGVPEESLAGAINRFARGEERKEADEYDAQKERESASIPDNFEWAQKRTSEAREAIDRYKSMRSFCASSDPVQLTLSLLVSVEMDRIKAAEREYGPNLVWAHQLPPDERRRSREESAAPTAELRALRIEVGKARRAVRSRLT